MKGSGGGGCRWRRRRRGCPVGLRVRDNDTRLALYQLRCGCTVSMRTWPCHVFSGGDVQSSDYALSHGRRWRCLQEVPWLPGRTSV